LNDSLSRSAVAFPNAFGERAVLKLMFSALIRAAERWRSIKVTDFQHRQIAVVKKELDQEYEAQVALKAKPQRMRHCQNIQQCSDLTRPVIWVDILAILGI
jgi:putative transposase